MLGNTQCPSLFSVTLGFLFVFGICVFFFQGELGYLRDTDTYQLYNMKEKLWSCHKKYIFHQTLLNTLRRATVSYYSVYKDEKQDPILAFRHVQWGSKEPSIII